MSTHRQRYSTAQIFVLFNLLNV